MKRLFTVHVFVLLALACISTLAAQSPTNVKFSEAITSGEKIVISSKVLGEDRQVLVYVPSTYARSRRRYPVIYTFDGEGMAPLTANAIGFMTGYSMIPQMPEAIVVGVVNTSRNRDMPIPEGYGKAGEAKFLNFVADELVSVIDTRYRTEPRRVLVGHSQGGLFAVFAMTERPKLFSWVVSIDAPLAGFEAARPLMDKAIALASRQTENAGRLISVENLYGWRSEWNNLATKLAGRFVGAQIAIKDETHETMAFKAVYEGLKRLFADYTSNLVRDSSVYTLADLQTRYRDLSLSYGYKVEIPVEVLMAAADRNLAIQHGAEALDLAKHAAAIYGDTNSIDRRLREAEETAKKGRDPRLEEWFSMSPPAADTMTPFLGSWERKDQATWMIEFFVKEGEGKALNTVIPPTFEPFHLDVQFVKVLSRQKIQWGERNGRGPGVTVFTAALTDANTLEGTAEQVGFIMNRPPFRFTYKRRTSTSAKETQ